MKGIAQLRLGRLSLMRGATAVEFALLFPLMFAITYGGIVYSYMYLLQQSVNFAAQQGAQAAVAVVPGSDPNVTQQQQVTKATAAAQSTLNWLPTNQRGLVSFPVGAGNCRNPVGTFGFEVDFAPASLFPMVKLPLVGSFPPVPTTIYACAVAYTS